MYIYCLQEIRPAAEMGPIILCLDTSGSMRGAREVVAKALALECMRGAHRQQRPCYLYAFSGPGEDKQLQGASCGSRTLTGGWWLPLGDASTQRQLNGWSVLGCS